MYVVVIVLIHSLILTKLIRLVEVNIFTKTEFWKVWSVANFRICNVTPWAFRYRTSVGIIWYLVKQSLHIISA